MNENRHFYIYHVGMCGYSDIRPLKFLRGTPIYNNKLQQYKESYGDNWEKKFNEYINEVNAFFGPVKKEYLELLRARGFTAYRNLANICVYTIDLFDPINFNKIEYFNIESTPQQTEFQKKIKPFASFKDDIYRQLSRELNIPEFQLRDDTQFEKLPEDIKKIVTDTFYKKINEYKTELHRYVESRLGIPVKYATKMDLYRLSNPNNKISYSIFEDMQNTKKWFEYNAKVGNKNQYASFIPHIQVAVNSPLKIAKVEKIF